MSDDIDERLAAWLDGALSPEEAAAFERAMAADPDLARRAQEWRANDAFIAAALAPVAAAPLDDAMLARMGLGPMAPAAPPPPVAANDNPPWWRRHGLPLGGALAAGLAAVLLLATPRGAPEADGLSLALDGTPSLHKARLADGRVIEPTLTVRAADGRWCREFRSGAQTGLACRTRDGWQVEAVSGGSGPADQGEIGLAAGADGKGLDAAYRRIGASDPLGADEEAGLIAKGWGDR